MDELLTGKDREDIEYLNSGILFLCLNEDKGKLEICWSQTRLGTALGECAKCHGTVAQAKPRGW